jgi:hypothetical protein
VPAVTAGRVIAANAKASARADVALPRALITSAPDITEFDLPPTDSPKFSGLIHYESAKRPSHIELEDIARNMGALDGADWLRPI